MLVKKALQFGYFIKTHTRKVELVNSGFTKEWSIAAHIESNRFAQMKQKRFKRFSSEGQFKKLIKRTVIDKSIGARYADYAMVGIVHRCHHKSGFQDRYFARVGLTFQLA